MCDEGAHVKERLRRVRSGSPGRARTRAFRVMPRRRILGRTGAVSHRLVADADPCMARGGRTLAGVGCMHSRCYRIGLHFAQVGRKTASSYQRAAAQRCAARAPVDAVPSERGR